MEIKGCSCFVLDWNNFVRGFKVNAEEKRRKVQRKYREKMSSINESQEYKGGIFFIFILIIFIFLFNSGSLFMERDVRIIEVKYVDDGL